MSLSLEMQLEDSITHKPIIQAADKQQSKMNNGTRGWGFSVMGYTGKCVLTDCHYPKFQLGIT